MRGGWICSSCCAHNVWRLKQELQCSKHAKVVYTIKLQAMDGRFKAGDAVRRETTCESEVGDTSRREAICGLNASHRAE